MTRGWKSWCLSATWYKEGLFFKCEELIHFQEKTVRCRMSTKSSQKGAMFGTNRKLQEKIICLTNQGVLPG